MPISNWTIFIANTTQISIFIHWSILAPNPHQLLHYFGLVKSTNGSRLISSIQTGNVTSVVFHGLLPFRKYRLIVVGVNRKGEVYRSGEVTAWTKEGGMYEETLWMTDEDIIILSHIYRYSFVVIIALSYQLLAGHHQTSLSQM